MGDSLSPNWVYPGVSYFAWESIQKFAAEENLAVEWRKDYREFFVRSAPSNYHGLDSDSTSAAFLKPAAFVLRHCRFGHAYTSRRRWTRTERSMYKSTIRKFRFPSQ